jgi:hypothetical protein
MRLTGGNHYLNFGVDPTPIALRSIRHGRCIKRLIESIKPHGRMQDRLHGNGKVPRRSSWEAPEVEKIMRKQSLFVGIAAVLVSSSVASAQDQPSQTNAPTALQSTTPDKPPVATVPEAATDVAGVPRRGETTGQAPNVSKKMGAEMDSAGDQRAAPDEQ